MANKTFQRVGGISPRRSVFDLSYSITGTCDMGQLVPVYCQEVVPGDKFTLGNQQVVRFQPMIAPLLHEVNIYTHYFFVPTRLLWDEWETFITRGIDGNQTPVLPRWTPDKDCGQNSLWDYLAMPMQLDASTPPVLVPINPLGAEPLSFPRDAYNLIWNEYYRDETLQEEIPLTNSKTLRRAWEKDYFTASLPWQQRGTAPALPISGVGRVLFEGDIDGSPQGTPLLLESFNKMRDGALLNTVKIGANPATTLPMRFRNWLSENSFSFDEATTFDVSDLRLAFQIQKWMERNARAGARYTEFLRSHYGVAPRDERLQRPEYIGGSKSPLIVSEVLQTSSTDTETPQGNMAGHGLAVDAVYCGNYRAEEFGYILGIMSIMPRTIYSQGIDRQYLRRTNFDFYSPEFANLSEQAIEQAEIFAQPTAVANTAIFGYQGRYDEMRYRASKVVGEMRTTFDYWHLARQFSSTAPPILNSDFIQCAPSKRIFAVQNVPGIIFSHGNSVKAVRPLPIQSEPGLIDHN